MAIAKHGQVNLETAKLRFRLTAHEAGLSLIATHPLESALGALLIGFLLGASPKARAGLAALIPKAVGLYLNLQQAMRVPEERKM